MKGYTRWDFHPYIPYADIRKKGCPYISLLAPSETGLTAEWYCDCGEDNALVFFRERDTIEFTKKEISDKRFTLSDLKENCEYELFVRDKLGRESAVRLVETGYVPGNVINYLHPEDPAYEFSGQYLCSPSIVRVDENILIASCDVFRGRRPQNLSLIFRSDDNGQTWSNISELFPCFWGRLFLHKGALYMLATSTEYGDLLIGRSDDLGVTWTVPTVIARGSSSVEEDGFHKAPVPVVSIRGRLYSAVEYGCWHKKRYANVVVSVDEDADLLRAENWTVSDPTIFDLNWEGAIKDIRPAAIEGNIVEMPDSTVVNFLRYAPEKALMLRVDTVNPDNAPEFVSFVDFPFAHTKFEIMRVPGKGYYACGNRIPRRNVLSLAHSEDMLNWTIAKDLIDYSHLSPDFVAFQYPTSFIEGNKLIVASRTAFNKSKSFHDSNYLTFHEFDID